MRRYRNEKDKEAFVVGCNFGHTPSGEWTTTIEPSCTESGERVKICTLCKAVVETEKIEANGHTLGPWTITEPATWISLGTKEATCEVCGVLESGKDWSKVWIIPAIICGGILGVIGVVNYAKSFKKAKRW